MLYRQGIPQRGNDNVARNEGGPVCEKKPDLFFNYFSCCIDPGVVSSGLVYQSIESEPTGRTGKELQDGLAGLYVHAA